MRSRIKRLAGVTAFALVGGSAMSFPAWANPPSAVIASNTGTTSAGLAPASSAAHAATSRVGGTFKRYPLASRAYVKQVACAHDLSAVPDYTLLTELGKPTKAKRCKGIAKGVAQVGLGVVGNLPTSPAAGNALEPVEKRSVPESWGTWGSPPFTESATPDVLYTHGGLQLIISFSHPIGAAGFEIEPNPFETHSFTATFLNGETTVGITTVDASGDAGAVLIGAKSELFFDSIVVTSDVDFAIAQVRTSDDKART